MLNSHSSSRPDFVPLRSMILCCKTEQLQSRAGDPRVSTSYFEESRAQVEVMQTEDPRVAGLIPILATIYRKDAAVHVLVTFRRPIGRTSRRNLGVSATSTGGRQR